VIAQDSGKPLHRVTPGGQSVPPRCRVWRSAGRSNTPPWPSATTTTWATPPICVPLWLSSRSLSTGSDVTNQRPRGFAFNLLTAMWVPEINTAITHLRDVSACPCGRNVDHRRHRDVRHKPSRHGLGNPMATGCRDLYQTDYTDRLGSGVWITNRSNRNRLINSQLWTCASLLASRVNTLFDTTIVAVHPSIGAPYTACWIAATPSRPCRLHCTALSRTRNRSTPPSPAQQNCQRGRRHRGSRPDRWAGEASRGAPSRRRPAAGEQHPICLARSRRSRTTS